MGSSHANEPQTCLSKSSHRPLQAKEITNNVTYSCTHKMALDIFYVYSLSNNGHACHMTITILMHCIINTNEEAAILDGLFFLTSSMHFSTKTDG